MKKILKISAIAVIIICIGMYVFIILPPGQHILKNIAQKQLSELTGQRVEIERLHTNLFSYIRIENFQMESAEVDSSDNVLAFRQLYVAYNLWGVLVKKITINSVELGEPKIFIKRDATGKYNLPEVFFSQASDTSKKETQESNGFSVQFNRAKIAGLNVAYHDYYDSLHVTLPEINASMNTAAFSNQYGGNLRIGEGNIQWSDVKEKFNELTIEYKIADDHIHISSMALKTDAINLKASGAYGFNDQRLANGAISGALNIDILNSLLFQNREDTLSRFEGSVNIQAELEGKIPHLNGTIGLDLASGRLNNIPVQNLFLDLAVRDQTYRLSRISLDAFEGQFEGTGTVSTENEFPDFNITLSLRYIELNQLLRTIYREPTFEPRGRISGNFALQGSGGNWREASAAGNIAITELRIRDQKVEDLATNVRVDDGTFSFELNQNQSFIKLVSHVRQDSTIDGQINGMLSDIESIASLANVQNLKGQLTFDGQLQGNLVNPAATLDFKFQNGAFRGLPISVASGSASYQDSVISFSEIQASGESEDMRVLAQHWPVDSLRGWLHYKLKAGGTPNNLRASAHLTWKNCMFNTFNLDSLQIDAEYSDKEITVNRFLLNEENSQAMLHGTIQLEHEVVADLGLDISSFDSTKKLQPAGKMNITGTIANENITAVVVGENMRFKPIFTLSSLPAIFGGSLSFDTYIYGPLNSPGFNITWMASEIGSEKVKLDSLNGKITYAHNLISITEIRTIERNGHFSITGLAPMNLFQAELLSSPAPRFNIAAHEFDLNFINSFLPDSLNLGGILSANLDISGALPQPELEGFLELNNARFIAGDFIHVDTMRISTKFDGHRLEFQNISGILNSLNFSFQGEGELVEKGSYRASLKGKITDLAQIEISGILNNEKEQSAILKINRLNLNSINIVYPLDFSLGGYADVLFSYTDSSGSPAIDFSMNSDRLGVDRAVLDSLQISAQVRDEYLMLSESGFKINNGWVKFGGALPIRCQSDSSAAKFRDIDIFAHAENMDINWMKPFLPALETIQGLANCKIFITGSTKEPVVDGYFFLQDGKLKMKNLKTPVQSLNIALQAENNEIVLDDLSGGLGKGTFKLKGQTHIVANAPTKSSLNLILDKPEINYPHVFQLAISEGKLTLTQNEENLKLKGEIKVSEAKYVQDFKPKIREILTQIPNRPRQESSRFLENIQLDINIQGQENIWVENNIAKIKLISNVNIFGTAAKPNLSGRVAVNKGYVLYLDRKFTITEGLIDFTDPLRINPYINLTAICTVTDYQSIQETSYEITLKLSGLLEKPDFVLTSNPPLDKADIVAVLTVGRTRETILSGSDTDNTTTFQELLVDRFKELTSRKIAGMTEQRIGRALALESISIEGNLFQVDKNWGPRVTATKQLSDRINITYSTVVGHANEQQIKLEYELFKYLSIIGNTGQTGQSGLDVKFHFKFY